MKHFCLTAGTVVVLLCSLFAASSAAKPLDRPALVSLMDRYLAALAAHNPSAVPLAKTVKLVENTQPTPVGKGLWETATGAPTDFRIVVADPVAGEVGFMGVLQNAGKPTIAAVRLKVVNGAITEVDHLVVPSNGKELNPNMSHVRPGLVTPITAAERVPRAKMQAIAASYYEALVGDDGSLSPFADDCQRRENGGISANDQTQTPEEAAKDDFSVFRKMTCAAQLSTNVMSYITDITDRRVLAMDEEMGLVFAFSIFRHDGEPKVMTIKNVPGVTTRDNKYGPFDLPAAHVFKIRQGKIYEIEAIGYLAKHGVTNGWVQPAATTR
jgi:hypothetical protein